MPIQNAIDSTTRRRVIEGAIALMNEWYVFPDVATRLADTLRARQRRGDYHSVGTGPAFAAVLTAHVREVSHDRHASVSYSPKPVTPALPGVTADGAEQYRRQMEAANCGFVKVERLPGNVGYVKFNFFGGPVVCSSTIGAAMTFVANTDALIIDLRENTGGSPKTVALIASYLFSKPTHLNDLWTRKTDSTAQFWTVAEVPGTRLRDSARVYLLTSGATFSGGEEFAYDLQSLKRGVVVGERTGGGAHPVSSRLIDEHFSIGVPYARAINPMTRTNWEDVGVQPDVAAPAADALAAAQRLIATESRQRGAPTPPSAPAGSALADPKPEGATQAIFAAFKDHTIVTMEAQHGLKDVDDFILSLIRHPSFADVVNVLIVEGLNSRYQAVLDRYVAGEDVPFSEVEKALDGHLDAFRSQVVGLVRRLNQTLPADKRLRVVAGEPPTDWSEMRTAEQMRMLLGGGRDESLTAVLDREVFAKGRKALVLYGTGHVHHTGESGIAVYERTHPAVFVIGLHADFATCPAALASRFVELEQRMRSWPVPSVARIRGAWLEEFEQALNESRLLGLQFKQVDALLYLGPLNLMMREPSPAHAWLDSALMAEVHRRNALAGLTDRMKSLVDPAAVRADPAKPMLCPLFRVP
jgi:hypothetical protein